jgi:acetylglutamate kinase
MQTLIEKTNVLVEALPYIKRFRNKTFVVKLGGSAMVQSDLKESFAIDIALLHFVGIKPVIVHGGGPQIGEMLEKLGIKSEFYCGFRITDAQTMDVVEMILGGKVNKEIVSAINSVGGTAVGLSGKDGQMIKAKGLAGETISTWFDGEDESKADCVFPDMGYTGRVERVDTNIIEVLDAKGFIPVIAPMGYGDNGFSYNINADEVAASVASALCAEKLFFLTDVPGIVDENETLIKTLTPSRIKYLVNSRVIAGGMFPKVQAALESLKSGVRKVHIVDGRIKHSLLIEIFTNEGIGTEIKRDSVDEASL